MLETNLVLEEDPVLGETDTIKGFCASASKHGFRWKIPIDADVQQAEGCVVRTADSWIPWLSRRCMSSRPSVRLAQCKRVHDVESAIVKDSSSNSLRTTLRDPLEQA